MVPRSAASWATRGSITRRASSASNTRSASGGSRSPTSDSGIQIEATRVPPLPPASTASTPASCSVSIASRILRLAHAHRRFRQPPLAGEHLLVAQPAGLDQVDDLLDHGVHGAVRLDRAEEVDLRSLGVDGGHVLCQKRAITARSAYRWWSVYRTARSSGSHFGVPMNALVKLHAEPGLWLADVPEPECGINDVLIRVLRTGICGTDLHIRNWDAWAAAPSRCRW